jgi:hypothetical protein
MGRHDEDRRRDERRGAVLRDDHGLEVVGHRQQPAPPVDEGDIPYEEPEQFGLRITWQSEDERLEAAEFLLATRIQEDTRQRLNREIDELRHREADAEDGAGADD